MKYSSLILLCVIICIVLSKCNLSANGINYYNNDQNNEMLSDNKSCDEQDSELFKEKTNYSLTVNGVMIDADDDLILDYNETYAELPLLSIIEALGGKTEWLNDETIEIMINDKVFNLSPYKLELYYSGVEENLFELVTGHDHPIYSRVSGNELIIDSDSIAFFFAFIDEAIRIDYENATVEIYYYKREFDILKNLSDSEY